MTDTPVTSAAVIDGVDVDAVAAAVTACPGVSGLFGGRGDTIASYLPGRRVPGVEVSASTVLITVRSRWGATAKDLLDQLTRAVSLLLDGKALEVVVADIDDPNEPPTPSASAPVGVAAVPSVQPVRTVTAEPNRPSSPVRLPGSSPATSAPTPAPSPPNFPTV